MIIAIVFMGPSLMFRLPDFSYLVLIGLGILGFSCGMVVIPVLPLIIEAIEAKYPNMDQEKLHNNITGIFISCQGIGEVIGPIFGSLLEGMYGFRHAQDLVSLTIIGFMIIFFIFCGGFSMFQ